MRQSGLQSSAHVRGTTRPKQPTARTNRWVKGTSSVGAAAQSDQVYLPQFPSSRLLGHSKFRTALRVSQVVHTLPYFSEIDHYRIPPYLVTSQAGSEQTIPCPCQSGVFSISVRSKDGNSSTLFSSAHHSFVGSGSAFSFLFIRSLFAPFIVNKS